MRKLIKMCSLTLVVLANGGLVWAEQPKVVFAPTTTDISVGHAAHSSIPIEMGFWKEDGLEVDVVGIQGSTAGVQQVAAKQVTFATVGPETVLMARAKGAEIKAIYTYARSTIQRALVLKGKGIETAEDLKGKTIGLVSMSTGSVPYCRQMLISAGVDPDKDVKWLAIGQGAQASLALRRNTVDAYCVWDTAAAPLEAQGMEFIEIKPPYHGNLIGNAIITHEDFLEEHPDIAATVARGIAKSAIFGLANPERAIRIHWSIYPQTKPQGDEAANLAQSRIIFESRFSRFAVPEGVKWGENIESQWAGFADLLKAEGLIPQDFDVTEAYTNELIDEINNFDPEEIAALATSEN